MNAFTSRLLLTLLFTPSAFAASSVDLTVRGLITPSACTPDLPGIIDYGKISAKDLSQDKHTYLEEKTIQLTVSCEASTLFAINPIDNRAGSSSSATHAYGLGLINGTEKLGRYFLTFRNPVTDIPSEMLTYRDGRWSTLWDDDVAIPNQLVAFGAFQADVGYLPHPLQNAAVEVALHTSIAPANTLTLTDEVALDGSTTLELKYL